MEVLVWSDLVCPWCYIGKRRLERALEGFEHAAEVEVAWRSFELDPRAPRQDPEAYTDRLARKYGMTPEEAEGMQATMTATAAAEGLELRFDRVRRGNTRDAHRLLHLAGDHGGHALQGRLAARIFRGYFTEGEPIGDRQTLSRLAVECGLDARRVRGVLDGDDYLDAVVADEEAARRLGVTGVPFFVVEGRYGVAGAQPADVLREVLELAWSHRERLRHAVGAGRTGGGSSSATGAS